jgi:uncharacterized protein
MHANPADSLPSAETAPAPPQQKRSIIATIFLGPNGIRAGWRFSLFLCFITGAGAVAQTILKHIPYVVRHFPPGPPNGPVALTPGHEIFGESLLVFSLLVAVIIMSRIEKRSFTDYGLPLKQFLGKRFWQGAFYGLTMISLLLLAIAALHGLTLGPVELGRDGAFRYGALYAMAFLLAGIFEEFSFRGYMQATLASGIGFWPAAILLSLLFGGSHLGNTGEAMFGAAMAGTFGILAAFSLRRTGNLWFAIGMHAGWDWAETYFFGTPNSGRFAKGRLFSTTFHGANWLTGGSVGPEGSYLVLAVLALAALGIHFLFPRRQINPDAIRRGS